MKPVYDDDPIAADILASPVEALRRELEVAGLHPVDAADAYPQAFAYFSVYARGNTAANDGNDRLVRLAAFDGSRGAPASIGETVGAGLLGEITGAQGAATLVLRGGVVELHLKTPAVITCLRLGAEDFGLSAMDRGNLVYAVPGLAEKTAYMFCFDHHAGPAKHPVGWS